MRYYLITEGGYPGMAELRRLDQCRRWPPHPVPQQLKAEVSPLSWEVWQECLAPHVDKHFTEYIISGIREGFWISFDYAMQVSERGPPWTMQTLSEST